MSSNHITFNDGAAYERFMGRWSHSVGEVFLRWLAPPIGLHWIDVGCGNGVFTELLFSQAHAAHVEGVDPSPGQLAFARDRLHGRSTALHQGSAEALPFADVAFDAATMALVIFFVPDPEQGVAEMVRVVRPGGLVAAYAWDMPGGGFPIEPVVEMLRSLDIVAPRPPHADVSAVGALEALWIKAGLQDVATHTIEVEREFESFDAWWSSLRGAPSLAAALDGLSAMEMTWLQDALRKSLQPDANGRIQCRARANAVRGVKRQ